MEWTTVSGCRAAVHDKAIRTFLLVLALLLPAPSLAAGFACSAPAATDFSPHARSNPAELDEVIIKPGRSTTRTRDLSDWLKRLEGQYRYDGYVDPCGNGNAVDQLPVTGRADCVSLYQFAPYPPNPKLRSLYCSLNVHWPPVRGENGAPVMGGESDLAPAVAVYGVVPQLPGIQFMQIDSKGLVSQGRGKLVGDMLTTIESCGMSGTCRKITQITARKGSKEIAMMVDVEIDSRRVLRNAFLLHRVSNVQLTRARDYDRARVEMQSVGER